MSTEREISYYPGCSVKTNGINFEKTALGVLETLGITAVELDSWYCCGVMYSMASDNLMYQLAPVRTLIKAKESNRKKLLVLCSMCYNTLKRAERFLEADEEKRNTIAEFMDRESTSYSPDDIEVVHILELLRDIGAKRIGKKLSKNVKPMKVAPYYGCLLTRPSEVAIDSDGDPVIMERIISAVGCEPVYFPFKTECCGSFQIVNEPKIVRNRVRKIVGSAVKNGAEAIVLSCPLCYYNLDAVQKEVIEEDKSFEQLPVLYLTQLVALYFGIDPMINNFSLHAVDPVPTLKKKGLL
jgi:heterodisulfide reductase subunit B